LWFNKLGNFARGKIKGESYALGYFWFVALGGDWFWDFQARSND
jgi:hypothetical protein